MATPDATRVGGTNTPVSRGLMARVTGAVQGAFSGWFGPGQPLTPVAPPTAAGRQFDYPYGLNLSYSPRGEQGQNAISFATLRRLADPAQGGLDLLRLAIETRKSQMAAQRWAIRGRERNDDGGAPARAMEALLRKPDGVTPFRVWARMLLEDHFVIDAPTIYFGASAMERQLFEVVDGATIKRLVDEGGRTPLPPLPAYQQFLHGLPATEYTISELGYYVFNQRPDRIYGMSQVEQVVGIVTIALNRQLSVLDYYTEGTVPDMLLSVPDTWGIDQIKQYSLWWNSELSGQMGQKRKVRFVPNGMEPTFAKEEILKNEFDEWLARIVCYCFSLSPQALVKQQNRGTAQTAKQTADEEGLEPEKLWFKDTMDDLLERSGEPGLEWQWQDGEITDPTTKATVISTYVAKKPIATVQQAREMAGMTPATAEELAEIQAMGAPAPAFRDDPGNDGTHDGEGDPTNPAGDTSQTEKRVSRGGALRKAAPRGGRSLRPLKRDKAALVETFTAIHDVAASVLSAQRDAVLAALGASKMAKTTKMTKVTAAEIRAVLDALPLAPWTNETRVQLEAALAAVSGNRVNAALVQVQSLMDEARLKTALAQANERAVSWSASRVGTMITEVSDTTARLINELTARAIDEGLTNEQLADLLADDFAFSDDRAIMIARTETAEAETHGTLLGWQESGVVEGKEWSADDEACDECQTLNGEVVGLDESFSGEGGDGPPLHPRCECLLAPVVAEEAETAKLLRPLMTMLAKATAPRSSGTPSRIEYRYDDMGKFLGAEVIRRRDIEYEYAPDGRVLAANITTK